MCKSFSNVFNHHLLNDLLFFKCFYLFLSFIYFSKNEENSVFYLIESIWLIRNTSHVFSFYFFFTDLFVFFYFQFFFFFIFQFFSRRFFSFLSSIFFTIFHFLKSREVSAFSSTFTKCWMILIIKNLESPRKYK